MDFNADQLLAIMKAFIKLTGSLGSLGFVQNKPHGWRRIEDN